MDWPREGASRILLLNPQLAFNLFCTLLNLVQNPASVMNIMNVIKHMHVFHSPVSMAGLKATGLLTLLTQTTLLRVKSSIGECYIDRLHPLVMFAMGHTSPSRCWLYKLKQICFPLSTQYHLCGECEKKITKAHEALLSLGLNSP